MSCSTDDVKKCKQRKKYLTIDSVCALIKACGEVGVHELKFGELHILFAPTEIGRTQAVASQEAQSVAQLDQEILKKEEVLTKEDQLSELLLTDPAEYERLMRMGELEDGYSGAE